MESFVGAFVGMRFEPAGMTDDPEVRIANSLIDYLFRRLAVDYLPREVREALGVLAELGTHAAVPPWCRGGDRCEPTGP
ncbi:MAG: hypothetical protein M5U19_15445 [Microthrixaceae bacterium]|nr:hypothetical protein [Microthrixaceae bacterium]